MKRINALLVTIHSDRIIADDIIKEIQKLGAKGYARSDVKGQGLVRKIERIAFVDEETLIRIQTIVTKEIADKIYKYLGEKYLPKQEVFIYEREVQVIREK